MIELVTDRTQADVDAQNQKGMYTDKDLNRVESAVSQLADLLRGIGYVLDVNPKTDWTEDDYPDEPNLKRYLSDLRKIRGKLDIAQGIPEIPQSMEHLTYWGANDIEKMLLAVNDTIERIKKSWWYSGEIYSGEV